MTSPRPIAWTIASFVPLLAALGALQVPASAVQEPNANPPAEKGPEELTRGPVHEAFGKPITFNAKPGLKIEKVPPAAIEELPPDEKPEGDNVSWIPGYWSYDDDRKDFIWVSGFWRTLPPDRTWVTGYWKTVADGSLWVSGYWASTASKETEYLPPPPDSLENGASTKAPSLDHLWIPGSWVWHDTRYVWRPGYWLVNQPGWIWVPSHYNWTPCGYVYVDGYWDWSVRKRGVLFAPVYVDRVYYTRPGYVYSPAIVIDGDVITDHFFVRASYCHYYFGDYYATTYTSVGITPWCTFHTTRYSYDPFYSYYECHYRRVDPGWSARIQVDFRYRVDHVDARPPRTFVQQQVVVNNVTNTKIVNKTVINNNSHNKVALGRSLKDVAKDKDSPTKFQRVEPEKRKQYSQEAKEVRLATAQRTKLEDDATKNAPRDGKAQPLRLTRPDSPVVARGNNNDREKGKGPPPLPASAKQDRDKVARNEHGGNNGNRDNRDKNDTRRNDDRARAGAGQDDKNKNDARRGDDRARSGAGDDDKNKNDAHRNDDKRDANGSKNDDASKGGKDKNNQGGNGNKPPPKKNPPKKDPPKSNKDKDKKKDRK